MGLDAADPRVAIEAIQAMNASVRNMVFAPAFFGTPFVLFATAFAPLKVGTQSAALSFGSGGLLYLLGRLILTMAVNVPMNEALADVLIPETIEAARDIWAGYSPRWQTFNILRTFASGGTLALARLGLFHAARA